MPDGAASARLVRVANARLVDRDQSHARTIGLPVRRLRHQLPLVFAVLVAGAALMACGSASKPSGPVSKRTSSAIGQPAGGSAGALSALRRQANQLLDGGPDAFKARLAELRGYPVVVNQWASWCGPCRLEFPFFARQAAKYAGRVAFLGVNSKDNRTSARAFLNTLRVPYPHYFDPDGNIARVFRGGRAFPTTVFYDASGTLVYTHIGGYPSEAELEDEIRRYASN